MSENWYSTNRINRHRERREVNLRGLAGSVPELKSKFNAKLDRIVNVATERYGPTVEIKGEAFESDDGMFYITIDFCTPETDVEFAKRVEANSERAKADSEAANVQQQRMLAEEKARFISLVNKYPNLISAAELQELMNKVGG